MKFTMLWMRTLFTTISFTQTEADSARWDYIESIVQYDSDTRNNYSRGLAQPRPARPTQKRAEQRPAINKSQPAQNTAQQPSSRSESTQSYQANVYHQSNCEGCRTVPESRPASGRGRIG